jgi:hypothetical protein
MEQRRSSICIGLTALGAISLVVCPLTAGKPASSGSGVEVRVGVGVGCGVRLGVRVGSVVGVEVGDAEGGREAVAHMPPV